jgi:hypothetical protein
MPWVPTRQWVVSVPIPLRYWMASSRDLTAQVHTIIHTTIAQYYINQAVSKLRHMIIPTPRQKGMDDDKLRDWNPILALGTAPGTGVSSGYEDVSILSTGLTAPHCRDHP